MGTGIKAQNDRIVNRYYHIVPFVGTGIKVYLAAGVDGKAKSYPSRVRGLKNGGRKDEQRRI